MEEVNFWKLNQYTCINGKCLQVMKPKVYSQGVNTVSSKGPRPMLRKI